MAKAVGISASSVRRIWRSHGLQRHRIRRFKLSNDPQFAAKLRNIVGLYVDPPAHARMQRHRHQEFIRFLNAIEAEVPAGKLIHAIVDNLRRAQG